MKTIASLVALVTFGLVAACGDDYDRTEVSAVIASREPDTVSVNGIRVTEGNIVKAHIVVFDDDNEAMPLTLRVTTPGNVLEVAPAATPHDYTFKALGAGRTQVELVADGERVLRINADVVAQPAP